MSEIDELKAVIEMQQNQIERLQSQVEKLQAHNKRNAPATQAAWMSVPIGQSLADNPQSALYKHRLPEDRSYPWPHDPADQIS